MNNEVGICTIRHRPAGSHISSSSSHTFSLSQMPMWCLPISISGSLSSSLNLGRNPRKRHVHSNDTQCSGECTTQFPINQYVELREDLSKLPKIYLSVSCSLKLWP